MLGSPTSTNVAELLEAALLAASNEDWPAVVIETEDLLDLQQDHPQALLLLANAALELGDSQNAASAFESHLRHAEPSEDACSGLALARFESCDVAGATEAARDAVHRFPDLAEAWYTLGLCLERTQGGATEAASCFAIARSLAPDTYPWPLPMSDELIQEVLLKALRLIPRPIARFWSGVPMRLEEEPTLHELLRGPSPIPPTVAGLYDGVPPELPAESLDDAFDERPKALRLFTRNLSRCGDRESLIEQLADVLVQEALDWLGLPLETLDEPT